MRRKSGSEDKLDFSRVLHADDFVTLRHELYDIYCSKNGDPQALNNDLQYNQKVSRLGERYLHILYLLEKHPEFKKKTKIYSILEIGKQ